MKLPKSLKLPEGTVIGKSAAESGMLDVGKMLEGMGVGFAPKGNVRHEPGRMNKLEAAYALHLEVRRHRGEIFGYFFESIKLRLADKTWYTPDFLVIIADGSLEFHETKGFRRDDAMVKIKVAAEQYPVFAFLLIEQAQGAWAISRFNAR